MPQIERYTSVPLFGGLEAPEIAWLLERSEMIEVRGGEMIIRQGEQGPGLSLCLHSGFPQFFPDAGPSQPHR